MMTIGPGTEGEAIARQRDLLAEYQVALADLLQQAAQHGGAIYAPPQILDGIVEAREQIAQIKAALRATGAAVDWMRIHPNHTEGSAMIPAQRGADGSST